MAMVYGLTNILQSLLERITNIVTGSDTRPDRTLSKALAVKHDLVGEGITNHKRAPIIKTHFPERRGYMMYNATRIILLVRNPYDAIDSYWNMCCTNTHIRIVLQRKYMICTRKSFDHSHVLKCRHGYVFTNIGSRNVTPHSNLVMGLAVDRLSYLSDLRI